MRRTRNIIQEIGEIRQRNQHGLAMFELTTRLYALEDAFKKHDKAENELIRYFPVAIIACVEGYFRMAIKELVDSGETFLTNAENPASSLKLDFSLLRAVHGKTVTVGELVAHGVQLSRLDHIDAVLSSLIGKGFLDSLRIITDRWAYEVKGEPNLPILSEPDTVFSDVARTFELRHMICHEIASAYEFKFDEIERCFKSCVLFMRASDEFISETINPGAPLTQTDMNIVAGKMLDERLERLASAVTTLKSCLDDTEKNLFEETQEKWQLYCDTWANFVAGERENGGTIWPVIYCGAVGEVVEQRIVEIENFKRLSDTA